MKDIKVPLSVSGLNDLLKKVNNLKSNLQKADKNIVDKLADYVLDEVQNNYSATPFKDGNDDVSFFKKGTDTKKTVGAMGKQVLYNEFGTGTQGQQNPHPKKNNFSLNPYNNRQGTTIRPNKNANSTATANGVPVGSLYWTYKKGEHKIYTTGIPAGMQVFNASISLKNKKRQIIKQEVSDALSKI